MAQWSRGMIPAGDLGFKCRLCPFPSNDENPLSSQALLFFATVPFLAARI